MNLPSALSPHTSLHVMAALGCPMEAGELRVVLGSGSDGLCLPQDGKCVQHHGERPRQPWAHTGSPGGLSPEEPGGRRHRGAGSVLPLRPGRGTVGKPAWGAGREETIVTTLPLKMHWS